MGGSFFAFFFDEDDEKCLAALEDRRCCVLPIQYHPTFLCTPTADIEGEKVSSSVPGACFTPLLPNAATRP